LSWILSEFLISSVLGFKLFRLNFLSYCACIVQLGAKYSFYSSSSLLKGIGISPVLTFHFPVCGFLLYFAATVDSAYDCRVPPSALNFLSAFEGFSSILHTPVYTHIYLRPLGGVFLYIF